MSQLALIIDTHTRPDWFLNNLEDSRNYTKHEFLFSYLKRWEGFSTETYESQILTSHETISRCKRKLVEKNPQYTPTNNINEAKLLKKQAFREWSKS